MSVPTVTPRQQPAFNRLAAAVRHALVAHAPQPRPAKPVEPEPAAPCPAIAAMTKALRTAENEGKEGHEKSVSTEVSSTPSVPCDLAEAPPPEVDAVNASGRQQAALLRRHAAMLGARIRAARELNGMALIEFATAVGHKNPTQPSLWEAGRRAVPAYELATVARALSVSVDYLLGLTDDPDADPSQARRTALVQHLREQLEAVAGGLADAVLESGAEVEAALRTTGLVTRCENVHRALERFRAANGSVFDDLRGGALVVRSVRELMEAAETIGAELGDVAERRARAARRARQAMHGTVTDPGKPNSEGAKRAAK